MEKQPAEERCKGIWLGPSDLCFFSEQNPPLQILVHEVVGACHTGFGNRMTSPGSETDKRLSSVGLLV